GPAVHQRGRLPPPPPPDQPGLGRRGQAHLEDPVGAGRAAQPRAHVHQHGVHEPAGPRTPAGAAADPGRIPPERAEAVLLDRLPVGEPTQALQHHHRGHHRRRYRTPTPLAEQVGEHLIGEQPVPLPRQEPVDRVLRRRLLTEPSRLVEQITLTFSPPQRHLIILPETRPWAGQRHAKNTSHLAVPLAALVFLCAFVPII